MNTTLLIVLVIVLTAVFVQASEDQDIASGKWNTIYDKLYNYINKIRGIMISQLINNNLDLLY